VRDPIGFFVAQRFPDVLAVPREMLEVGRVRSPPLAMASLFAINAASGIQDNSSPFYTEGELKGRKVKNATKNPQW
jgi:hypothetical protein